jgi:hypothetical protein
MVKKYKKPKKVSSSSSLSVDDIDKKKKFLKERIVNEDGGYTIVNPDRSYREYNKDGKLIDLGESYRKLRSSKDKKFMGHTGRE